MKPKDVNARNALYPKQEKFIRMQFTRGFPLAFVGLFVYAFFLLIGKKPKNYYGVCKYFEIGKNWGGFGCGWFFVCAEDSDEGIRDHEVGHGVFNANIGGFRTLFYSVGSMFRYWYRSIFRVETDYDAWWFENTATTCGTEYMRRIKLPQLTNGGDGNA